MSILHIHTVCILCDCMTNYTPCFSLQACTAALQEIPAVNAVIDDSTNEIVYRNYVDVSVAVASPNGLVVPVLRNTEKMGFAVSFYYFLLMNYTIFMGLMEFSKYFCGFNYVLFIIFWV